jgi:hypothetical protein
VIHILDGQELPAPGLDVDRGNGTARLDDLIALEDVLHVGKGFWSL